MFKELAKSSLRFTKYEESLVRFSTEEAIKTGDSRQHYEERATVAKTESDKHTCRS